MDGDLVFLGVALLIALAFEFVNGFHDTANAVATVIYTKSLKPQHAVVWSGICNFLGVSMGGIAVAFSIVNLLPVDLLVETGGGKGKAMVLALLLSAIIWNLGTWWLAIPASSSHTMIGAILGIGIAGAAQRNESLASGVNWAKAAEIGMSLFLSPLLGFCAAAALLLAVKFFIPHKELHEPPAGDKPPPWWVRSILIITCTGVSFAHGSNDGQKGIGLIMLILIGTLPATFALNPGASSQDIQHAIEATREIETVLAKVQPVDEFEANESRGTKYREEVSDGGIAGRHEVQPANPHQTKGSGALAAVEMAHELEDIRKKLGSVQSLSTMAAPDRWPLRSDILLVTFSLAKTEKVTGNGLTPEDREALKKARGKLRKMTDHAPGWVLVAVALALGLGTMVGWERIVVTVGEKIGKTHMTYAQGASAELVAMTAIGAADVMGLPVSTTHVLSSGIAGTMAAQRSGLQLATVHSLALAWVLTLPVCIFMSGALFFLFSALFG